MSRSLLHLMNYVDRDRRALRVEIRNCEVGIAWEVRNAYHSHDD